MSNIDLKTKKTERYSYFGFFLGQNLIYVIVFQYFLFFLTEEVGIAPAAAALLIMVPKIWDAINDPMMGVIVDKTNLKGGKFLPWIRIVCYALPLSTILLFVDFGVSEKIMLAIGYVLYILWGMIYTIGDVPAFSLSTVMTDIVPERDKLLSLGRLGAVFAALLSAGFMSFKVAIGYTGTAAVYVIFSFLVMVPLSYVSKERIAYKRNKNITLVQIFKHLFKNKYLLRYFIGYFAIMAVNTLQVLAVYFAKFNLGDEGLTTAILATSIVPLLFVVPFLPKMIDKFGKKNMTIYCSFIFIGLSFVQYFAGYSNIYVFMGISAIRTIFMQIPLQIYGMFTADCIEYGAYTSGERVEGIAFSIQTFVTKLGGAICAGASIFIMGKFGYIEQGAVQPDSALNAIWLLITLLPTVGFIIMIIIMHFFYDLKETDVQKMIFEMQKTEENI